MTLKCGHWRNYTENDIYIYIERERERERERKKERKKKVVLNCNIFPEYYYFTVCLIKICSLDVH